MHLRPGQLEQLGRLPVSIIKCLQMTVNLQLSLVIPSWVRALSTSQRAVMPCGWGVKAGMVYLWVAGKTVIPLLHAGHI